MCLPRNLYISAFKPNLTAGEFLAIEAFRRVNDCGRVFAVQKMLEIEEKQLLYGHVYMFLGHFNRAQEFFLASSKPETALEVGQRLSSNNYRNK